MLLWISLLKCFLRGLVLFAVLCCGFGWLCLLLLTWVLLLVYIAFLWRVLVGVGCNCVRFCGCEVFT